MALTSVNFTRPAATTQNNEAIVLTAVALEDTAATPDTVKLDLKATVNAAARLIHRTRITPEYSGSYGRLKYEYLSFASSADQTYADDDTTPFTDAEADSATLIGYSPWMDLDAFYTLAGDARS